MTKVSLIFSIFTFLEVKKCKFSYLPSNIQFLVPCLRSSPCNRSRNRFFKSKNCKLSSPILHRFLTPSLSISLSLYIYLSLSSSDLRIEETKKRKFRLHSYISPLTLDLRFEETKSVCSRASPPPFYSSFLALTLALHPTTISLSSSKFKKRRIREV